MTRRKNPFPGVTRIVDQHGKTRFRFRSKGFTCYLPGHMCSASTSLSGSDNHLGRFGADGVGVA